MLIHVVRRYDMVGCWLFIFGVVNLIVAWMWLHVFVVFGSCEFFRASIILLFPCLNITAEEFQNNRLAKCLYETDFSLWSIVCQCKKMGHCG